MREVVRQIIQGTYSGVKLRGRAKRKFKFWCYLDNRMQVIHHASRTLIGQSVSENQLDGYFGNIALGEVRRWQVRGTHHY